MSGLTLILAKNHINNHWMRYAFTPIALGLVLWAISWWQATESAARLLRRLIPLLIVIWIPIVLFFENTRTFSLLDEPLAGLLILVVSVYTLASRAARETGSLSRNSWFWGGLGLAIYHGAAVALTPTGYWLLDHHPDLVSKALQLNAVIEILAFLVLARAMTTKA